MMSEAGPSLKEIGHKITSRIRKKLKSLSPAPEIERPPVILEEGPFPWTVYIEAEDRTWHLMYEGLKDLPVSNADYHRLVQYREDLYRLQRAWEKQLQVTRE